MNFTSAPEAVASFVQAFDELKEIRKVLHGDYQFLHDQYQDLVRGNLQDGWGPKGQQLLRNLVRAFFATSEGITFAMKQVALTLPRIDAPFTVAEECLLKEIEFVLDDRGNATTRNAFLRTRHNFRFAYRMMERAFELKENPIFGTAGWESFGVALKLRDRLTHPKASKDLVIELAESGHFADATLWFHSEFNKLIARCDKSLKSAIKSQSP